MERRQEAIRSEFAELDEAKAEAKGAEEEYKAQLADARKEAARIREEAREQGSQIVAEARDAAVVEANRVKEHGAGADRRRAPGRAHLAPQRGRVARDHPGRPDRGREPGGRRAQHARRRPLPGRPRGDGVRQGRGVVLMLRGASAEALRELTGSLGSSGTLEDQAQLGRDLFGVVGVLRGDAALRRALTDNSVEGDSRSGLATAVFGSAVGDEAATPGRGRGLAPLDLVRRPRLGARAAGGRRRPSARRGQGQAGR